MQAESKRAVRLQDDCHLHAIREETSSDDNTLTELRMVRIVDLGFCRDVRGQYAV